jgi:uridine kinase
MHAESICHHINQIEITKRSVIFIGVCGASASGKTYFCRNIHKGAVVISLDSFYLPLTEKQIEYANRGKHDFDHPNCFDWDLVFKVISSLKKRQEVTIPTYNYKEHKRSDIVIHIEPSDVVILEGIHSLWYDTIVDLMDLRIFIDTDPDTCLIRRIERDIQSRGRKITDILCQYKLFVKPAYENYIEPKKKHASIIIPFGKENHIAIEMVNDFIMKHLQ